MLFNKLRTVTNRTIVAVKNQCRNASSVPQSNVSLYHDDSHHKAQDQKLINNFYFLFNIKLFAR